MNDQSSIEARIGALIAAYSEQAPTDVDPMAMARLAVGGPGRPFGSRLGLVSARTARFAIIAAALAAMMVAGALFVGGRQAVLPAHPFGLVRVPPQGTLPSTPERGELLVSYWGPSQVTPMKGWWWIYADGRVIFQGDENFIVGPVDPWTGFLERRLTPEAAERVRLEVIRAAGLDPANSAPSGRQAVPWYSAMSVRDGDHVVQVGSVSNLGRIIGQITDPASWLPPSAWVEQEPTAYVPARYAVCYAGHDQVPVPGGPLGPSEILSFLPAAVVEPLRGVPPTPWDGDFPGGGYCSIVTTDVARTVAKAVDAAVASGVLETEARHPLLFGLKVTPPNVTRLHIWFAPVLPNGEWKCLGCG